MKSYTDGNLILEKKVEDGKGKCPFDPFQTYASIMVGELDNLNLMTPKHQQRKDNVSRRTHSLMLTITLKGWLRSNVHNARGLRTPNILR